MIHWLVLPHSPKINDGIRHEVDEQITVLSLHAEAIELKTFFLRSGFSGTHSCTCFASRQASSILSVPLINASCSEADKVPRSKPDSVNACNCTSISLKAASTCSFLISNRTTRNPADAKIIAHDRPIKPEPTIPI